MAEGARLESVFTGNRNVGSNPTLSANILSKLLILLNNVSRSELSGALNGAAANALAMDTPGYVIGFVFAPSNAVKKRTACEYRTDRPP